MDYERIQQPEGGGLSPGKLRTILLGAKRKSNQEEGLRSNFTSRSHSSSSSSPQIHDAGDCGSDNCKDVDVVTVLPECSSSTAVHSLGSDIITDRRLKTSINSRHKIQEDSPLDYDGGHDAMSVSSTLFEFQKAERPPQRVPLGPFSKPAPSKWDDAQKWIASPTSSRPKLGQAQVHGGQGVGSRKAANVGYQLSAKVVVEVPEQRVASFEEPDTKRMDTNQAKMECAGMKFVSWEVDHPYPIADSYGKPVLMIENSVGESVINLSQHDSSVAIQSATTFIPPPSTARSVSMRDMGTEMTPIASQEPSRTGTPVRATTPMRSPISSRPTTPGRASPASSPSGPCNDHLELNRNELSEKELQMKTRREILVLGTQLGKMNIAAWASKGGNEDASTSLKTLASEKPAKSVSETRAAAWEEAEKAKYLARFKREEMKIQAWENHQKAKTEAEMRKVEVEVERMRGQAHDKLMNKLAAARHKAEEKRAAAETKRNRQASKTEQQTEYIRRTGRIHSSFSCCGWCS